MLRVACVALPDLALALFARAQPSSREGPRVVLDHDRALAKVIHANAEARRLRIAPGLTLSAARDLAPDLDAGVVSPHEIEAEVTALFRLLTGFSPRVEPAGLRALTSSRQKALTFDPGVFWLDADGLEALFGSLETWSQAIEDAVASRGLVARCVVGFRRFSTYAIARGLARSVVFASPDLEAKAAHKVPLSRLDLPPKLLSELSALQVHTLGAFVRLPLAELALRLGPIAAELHAQARGDRGIDLTPRAVSIPIRARVELEHPDDDRTRLLSWIEGALHKLLRQLVERGLAVCAVELRLDLDHAAPHHERIVPARPTLDFGQLLELARLRLESIALDAKVESFELELEGAPADHRQLALFEPKPRRDLEAGNRALARLRTMFGPHAVTRARTIAAHLPEARFRYEPLTALSTPSPAPPQHPSPLMRRLLPRPELLPSWPRHAPHTWLHPLGVGAVTRMTGPYRTSGGWWVRIVERDYYYVETERGDLLWVFYDRPRNRWFLHGVVD